MFITVIVNLIHIWLRKRQVVIHDKVKLLLKIFGLLTNIAAIVIVIWQYVLLGDLWTEDPKHYAIFYKEYWTESVVDYNAYNATNTVMTIQANNMRILQELSTITTVMATFSDSPLLPPIPGLITQQGSKLLSAVDRALLARYISIVPSDAAGDILRKLQAVSEGISDTGVQLAPRWVYTLSDVLIRFQAFVMSFFPLLLGFGICFLCFILLATKIAIETSIPADRGVTTADAQYVGVPVSASTDSLHADATISSPVADATVSADANGVEGNDDEVIEASAEEVITIVSTDERTDAVEAEPVIASSVVFF